MYYLDIYSKKKDYILFKKIINYIYSSSSLEKQPSSISHSSSLSLPYS